MVGADGAGAEVDCCGVMRVWCGAIVYGDMAMLGGRVPSSTSLARRFREVLGDMALCACCCVCWPEVLWDVCDCGVC